MSTNPILVNLANAWNEAVNRGLIAGEYYTVDDMMDIVRDYDIPDEDAVKVSEYALYELTKTVNREGMGREDAVEASSIAMSMYEHGEL